MGLTDEQIKKVLKGCRRNKRNAQKELYSSYFNYAITIALRYSNDYDIAVVITNDAFLKIYEDLKNFVPRIDNTVGSFKAWLRNAVFDTCMEHERQHSAKPLAVTADTRMILFSGEFKTA